MKLLIPSFLLIAISFGAKAQQIPGTTNVQRNLRFRTIGRDSVNLNLNENYLMIEDSCSVIIRQGHFNIATRIFTGKFKDVNKANPSVVLSSGTYDSNGLKNGEFIAYNLDGSLQSKGNYHNNKFDGEWEINYSNGKPALTFAANNDTIRIESAWDKNGKQIVDKGKGSYSVIQGSLTWKGKLNNGRPEGLWALYRTDDASENELAMEQFKKGVFQRGKNAIKEYTDASHIYLINNDLLPFLNAEKLIAAPPCNSTFGKHIVGAQYKDGTSNFGAYIFNTVGNLVNLRSRAKGNGDWLVDNTLIISGNISEKGELVDMKSAGPFNGDFGQDVIRALRRLPLLEPATVDGKAVKQEFSISLVFKGGTYTTNYRFLPIKA